MREIGHCGRVKWVRGCIFKVLMGMSCCVKARDGVIGLWVGFVVIAWFWRMAMVDVVSVKIFGWLNSGGRKS